MLFERPKIKKQKIFFEKPEAAMVFRLSFFVLGNKSFISTGFIIAPTEKKILYREKEVIIIHSKI